MPDPGRFIQALLGSIGTALSGGGLNLPSPFDFKRRRCRNCRGRRRRKESGIRSGAKDSVASALGVSAPSCPT